jgi:hypothetical protein
MIDVHASSTRRTRLRRAVLTATLLVTGLAVSGCVRVNADLTVSGNDQVSGDVVVAALPTADSATGPQLTVPPALKGRVTTKPYSADGFIGEDVAFHNLSFDEFSALTATAGANSGHYQLTLRRSEDDLVGFSGSADLTLVPAQNSSVQLKIAFPGSITQTDGKADGDTVTWKLTPGQVNTFGATAQYSTGGLIRPWSFWATALAGAGGVIALFLLGLSLLARRRNLRKDQPATPEPTAYSGY